MDLVRSLDLIRTFFLTCDALEDVTWKSSGFNDEMKNSLRRLFAEAEKDLVILEKELQAMKRTCESLNIDTHARNGIPWRIPNNVNLYLRWRYRRAASAVSQTAARFSESLVGLMDLIACLEGLSTKTPSTLVVAMMKDYKKVNVLLTNPQQVSLDELYTALGDLILSMKEALANTRRMVAPSRKR